MKGKEGKEDTVTLRTPYHGGMIEIIIIIRVWLFIRAGKTLGDPLRKIILITKYHSEDQLLLDFFQENPYHDMVQLLE